MIEIDGSDGGGQFLRSALSLSALTGEAFEIANIRGGRPTPGLRPQHLSTVELLSDVCDAEVSETTEGTESLTFRPKTVRSGAYTADIRTAGSIALLFDSILPLAMTVSEPIVVTARGGTDVKWSPTAAHYCQVKLRLLRQFGLQAIVDLDRPGFFPVGGGEATLRVGPSQLNRLEMAARNDFVGARVFSLSSASLSEQEVSDRQAEAAVDGLENEEIQTIERTVRYAEADSPGSSVVVRLDWNEMCAGFDAIGEPGKPAEKVASDAVEAAIAFKERTEAVVDRHTADQLMVFLALAGGSVAVPEVTEHITTSQTLLSAFGFDTEIKTGGTTPLLNADAQLESRVR